MKLSNEEIELYNSVRETPDKTVLCHAPFVSINFEQGGNATACCYNRSHVLGQYPENSIKQIWFGAKANELREYMQANDLSHGCEMCAHQIKSKNFEGNLAKGFDIYTKPLLKEQVEAKNPLAVEWELIKNNNPTLKKIGKKIGLKFYSMPRVMEFEIDNTCNLECVMCSGKYSSLIRKNREKAPPIPNPYNDNFVEQLTEFIPYLKEVKFLGGEPFLTPIYYKIWDKIADLNPSLKIYITTNGTVLTKKVKEYLDKLNINIVLSVDSLVKETYESIRINARYENLIENLEYFKEYTRSRNRFLGFAVCPMTVNRFEIPTIVEYCNQHQIKLYFNTVIKPYEYSFRSLEPEELELLITYYKRFTFSASSKIEVLNKLAFESLLNYIVDIKNENTHRRDLIARVEKLLAAIKFEEFGKSFSETLLASQKLSNTHIEDTYYINNKDNVYNAINEIVDSCEFTKILSYYKTVLRNYYMEYLQQPSAINILDEKLDAFNYYMLAKDHRKEIFKKILHVDISMVTQSLAQYDKEHIVKLMESQYG